MQLLTIERYFYRIIQCSISWADLTQSKALTVISYLMQGSVLWIALSMANVEYVHCNCVNLYFRSTAILDIYSLHSIVFFLDQQQYLLGIYTPHFIVGLCRSIYRSPCTLINCIPANAFFYCFYCFTVFTVCVHVVELFYFSLRMLLKELSRNNRAHPPLNLQRKNDAQLSLQISTKVHVSNAQAQFRGDCPSLRLIARAPG